MTESKRRSLAIMVQVYALAFAICVVMTGCGAAQAASTRTVAGTLAYHFWMQKMKPLQRLNGNQYMHRELLEHCDLVKRKLRAYHLFIQAGLIARGLLHYLAVAFLIDKTRIKSSYSV